MVDPILWNIVEGSGGLGVVVRVPGLVKPPSLVSSAVVQLLVLLHVDTHDMPRTGLLSDWSSIGELVLEFDLSALVKSDSLRSTVGLDLAKEESLGARGAGRGVRDGSGGSSRSATTSSSELMAGNDVLGMLRPMSTPAMFCFATWSWSFAIY